MKKVKILRGLGILLANVPFVSAIEKYSEAELAQSQIANTIFFGYLIVSIIVLVVVWWLSTRKKNSGKDKTEKIVKRNKKKKR